MDGDDDYAHATQVFETLQLYDYVHAAGIPIDQGIHDLVSQTRGLPQSSHNMHNNEDPESIDGSQIAHGVSRVTSANLPYHDYATLGFETLQVYDYVHAAGIPIDQGIHDLVSQTRGPLQSSRMHNNEGPESFDGSQIAHGVSRVTLANPPYDDYATLVFETLQLYDYVHAAGIPIDQGIHDLVSRTRGLPQSSRMHNNEDPEGFDGSQIAHGVSRVTLANLPYHVINLDNMKDIAGDCICCLICLQDVRQEEMVRSLPICRHTFHMTCIDNWLQKQLTCPLCRRTILSPT